MEDEEGIGGPLIETTIQCQQAGRREKGVGERKEEMGEK